MKNIRLILAYDGGPYLGWQKTKEGPSIEETVQGVLERILQEPVHLQAASRTDAGVHAEGQVVNFLTARPHLDLHRLGVSLNSLLPGTIALLNAEEASPDFHPTLDCKQKEYHYWACFGFAQMPKHRLYSWHYPHPLDIEGIRSASRYFLGKHNFQAFCNELKNATYEHYVREIFALDVFEWPGNRLQIVVRGNNFVYRMVRNIVGTLLHAGRKKIFPEAIPEILSSLDRTRAGPTAPAHGLTLFRVLY